MADAGVAMVTGAGRGIGAAIARRLAADGLAVALCDVDADLAGETAGRLSADGARARGFRVDVARGDSVAQAVDAIGAALGPIDVLVNNAGIDVIALFLDTDEAAWDRLWSVNVKGVLHCCQRVLPGMISRGRGRIVNLASDAGRVGSTGEAVYSATKGGVIAFTKALAREMARHGITVNCVAPGPTDTALFAQVAAYDAKLHAGLARAIPLGRIGRPDDVAGAVAFLASADAAYVTGQTLSVSGGLTMA
jgi:2-hydroxycyclohexanecarboxyl-CoA dehydrogenase